MKKRKLKSFVVPVMYVASIAMLLGSVYAIEKLISDNLFKGSEVEEVVEDVSSDVPEDNSNDMPVINTEPIISRPYINGSVQIVKNYYDYQADNATQEKSIVYYGNTYMQNSGVDYGMGTEFEVVSILDGTVMEIIDDEIMGKTIKIKHNNDLISVYQSMGSIDVNVNDNITQGMIIGKSGEANVSPELGNHLHFELYHKGSVVNPENYYDKLLGELQ